MSRLYREQFFQCIAGCGRRTWAPDDVCRSCLRAEPDALRESELGPLATTYEYQGVPEDFDPWTAAGGDDCYA